MTKKMGRTGRTYIYIHTHTLKRYTYHIQRVNHQPPRNPSESPRQNPLIQRLWLSYERDIKFVIALCLCVSFFAFLLCVCGDEAFEAFVGVHVDATAEGLVKDVGEVGAVVASDEALLTHGP